MPTVSIIITTYRRPEFFKQALDSVLKQTYQDIEIIVIDNASEKWLVDYLKQYPQVNYFANKINNISHARNLGIKQAKGQFIAFLDDDDYWHKDKIQDQLDRFAKSPQIGACYTEEKWFYLGKHLNQHKKHQKYGGWIFAKVLPLCLISPSSIMIPKKIFAHIGIFDTSFKVCEDYEFWLRLSLAYPIEFIEHILLFKNGGHQGQLSRQYWGMDRFRVKALIKTLKNPQVQPDQQRLIVSQIITKLNILYLGAKKRHRWFFALTLYLQIARWKLTAKKQALYLLS